MMLLRLKSDEVPEGGDYKDNINPDSLIILYKARLNWL